MVAAVDQNARLDRIDELQRQIDEGRERIRQRQEERERNPELMDDHLRAERDCEPAGTAYTQREAPAADLVYRRYEGAPTPAATAETATADWNAWFTAGFDAHYAPECEALIELLTESIAEFVTEYVGGKLVERDREIDVLKGELRETKAMLADVLKQFEQHKTFADKLEADRTGLKVRLARLEGMFHGKLNQLAQVADHAGLLPRGWDPND